MIQEIIALTIVFVAVAYAVYSIVKSLRSKNDAGCGDSCACGTHNKVNEK